MADADGGGMSKSAKRRAAKKARDAGEAEEAVPATVEDNKENKPKVVAKPKTEQATAEVKPKAKAEAKAVGTSAPKAEAQPKPETKKKAEGKAGAKAKAKAKANNNSNNNGEEDEPAPAAPARNDKTNEFSYTFQDDGSGGDWECSTGKSKKQMKREEKKEEQKKMEQVAKGVGGRTVPGMQSTNIVPGMNPGDASGKPLISQSLMATPEQIAAIYAKQSAQPEDDKPKEPSSCVTITIPEEKIGIVIGPKGATIKMIQERSGAPGNLRVDTSGNICTITGPPQYVPIAEKAIRELIEKGYTALSFDDFKEEAVPVPSQSIPDIIGVKGAHIIAIKKGLGVEIKMPDTPKDMKSGPKRVKVTIAGKVADVDKAKDVINDIVMYYHHEYTHPEGVTWVHEEMEMEEYNYRFIIGKAGSELRHIEKNYKVRVRIPREDTVNKNVVVVGEKINVDRAVHHIHRVVYEASQPRGRGGADKADDHWGEDDDIDPELERYIYKR